MSVGRTCTRFLNKSHLLRRNPRLNLAQSSVRSTSTRQWSTPLAKNIAEAIATTGPISIAAYMRQCLTSSDGGYYTSVSDERDPFGPKGDFITSPEISQVFGELLGIWLVAEWMAQGRINKGVEIIEVGPGRGTLMDDMLRTISQFKPLASSVEQIYLVEASPSLRTKQKNRLCGDAPMQETEIGFQSTSKHLNIPITWCEDIQFVPEGPSQTPFIFAHEFFDALPIHAFQSTIAASSQPLNSPTGPIHLNSPEWRELVVTPTPPPPSSSTFLSPSSSSTPSSEPTPDFQISVSKSPTPHSRLLPTISPRYKALLHHPSATIEISPESRTYIANFARRIGSKPRPSGAALILDYGPSSTIPTSTLRGILAHKRVSPFLLPGRVDLSCDVDFTALAEAALTESPQVEVHGPVEQGAWLQVMGVRERAAMIGGGGGGQSEWASSPIMQAVERLIGRGGGAGGGMGRIYKVMAVVPESGGRRKPVGFGGAVDG